MKSQLSYIIWFICLGFLLQTSAQYAQHQSSKISLPFWLEVPQEIRSVLTLGHTRLYQDYLFLWSIQAVTSPKKSYQDSHIIGDIFYKIAQEHIPTEPYYMMTCFYLSDRYNAPSLCNPIATEGLKVFPGSWRLLMTQAYIEAFRLGHHQKGSKLYKQASEHKLAPDWVSRLAEKLLDPDYKSSKDYEAIQRLMKKTPGFFKKESQP